MTSAEKLLRELIALPSVNNAFLPAGHPRAGERRVGEFLAAFGRRAGLDVGWQPVSPGRSNLFLRLSPKGRVRKKILLAPHLDTVEVASEEQLVPRRRGGRLYGRGACDTKGSVAAMVTALCELASAGPRPQGIELGFVGLIDEETAQTGSRRLADSGFKADLAIVGEPTRLKVVTSHKGNLWITLQTRGKAAHGARPELGKNAIRGMAPVVELIEKRYGALLRRRSHPLLGHPTVNVGTICGGLQANIVPAQCSITIDRRTLPGETDAGVERELRGLLREAGLEAFLSNAKAAPCIPLETDPDLPLVRQLLQSAHQKSLAGVDYFSDAGVLAQGGIPSVVFGPGDIAQAHTADEWISVAELDRARAILSDFLRRAAWPTG